MVNSGDSGRRGLTRPLSSSLIIPFQVLGAAGGVDQSRAIG